MSSRLPTFAGVRASLATLSCVRACGLVAVVTLSLALPAAASAAQPIGVGAPEATFVAGWDGESDSTAIELRLARPGRVGVYIRGGDGTRIRTLASGMVLPRGISRLYWDGRRDNGALVAPGNYTVVARIAAGAGASGAAGGGQATATAGSSGAPSNATTAAGRAHAAITVQRANVSIADLDVTRGFLADRAGARSTRVRFRLSGSGFLSAAVVDAAGTVVRNLHRGAHHGGGGSLSWDGRSDRGARVGDGTYTLLLASSAGQMPSTTLRVPLRLDTRKPQLTVRGRTIAAKVRGGRVVLPLRVRASEHGRLTIRGPKGKVVRRYVARGAGEVLVDGAELGLIATQRATRYRLRLTFADAAGNAIGRRVFVRVRAVRATPAATVPARPAPVTPPGSGLAWPVRGVLTSLFGPRDGHMHQGIDVGTASGTPIVAAAAGIVSFSGTSGGYGNLVVVEHPGGMSTAYAHQSTLGVVAGEAVARGQVIGLVGSTGHSTGPHLHFETRVGGLAVDPMRFLPAGGPPA